VTARTIPEFGAPTPADRVTLFAAGGVVAALLVATWFGYVYGTQAGPKSTAFIEIVPTLWAFAELLTAFLLFSQFCVAGRISHAIVAAGYLMSGLLTIPYLLFFPSVILKAPATGDLQISVSLWLAWHFAFPIAVATSLIVSASRTNIVPHSHIPRTLGAFLVGTAGASVAIFAAIFFARDWLPVLILGGGVTSPVYRLVAAPAVVAVNGITIFMIGLRGCRITPLQTWLGVALVTMVLDGLLNMSAPGRFSYAWYIGKFEALIMANVVMFMLLLEIAALYRRLHDVATIDVLTGLPNRRSFMDVAADTLTKPAAISSGVALLLIDVDQFKAYNDRYGHIAGDEALAAGASALRTSLLRSADSVARYGGEEFVILLPNTGPSDAEMVAERVRQRVASLGIVHDGSPQGRLTVSLGVGHCAHASDLSEPILFEVADRALYEAKSRGRDCVVLSQVRETEPVAAAQLPVALQNAVSDFLTSASNGTSLERA